MCSLSDGEVNTNTTTIDLHSGALLFGSFSIVVVFIIHETKSARTTSFGVKYYLNAFEVAVFGEYVSYLTFSRVNAESENA